MLMIAAISSFIRLTLHRVSIIFLTPPRQGGRDQFVANSVICLAKVPLFFHQNLIHGRKSAK